MIKKLFLFILVIICIGWSSNALFNRQKKVTEFVFWTIQLRGVADGLIKKNIETFKHKHPDIEVTWVDIPIAETQKRILASTLSSTPPDLVNLNPDFSSILAKKGAVEFLKEEDVKNYNKELQNMLRYKGKAFAIPFYATSPVTLYNKKVFNDCAIKKVPETYEELFEISPKLKKCAQRETLSVNLNENDTFAKILNKYNVYNSLTASKNAYIPYTLFKNFFKSGYISKESLTLNHREIVEKYMAETALSVVVGANFIKYVEESALETYKKSDVAPQLTGKNGKYDVALMNLVIPKKARNKALALEFAHQLTGVENQLELSRLTNVLPANKYALENPYFKNTKSTDLLDKARVISAKQLSNLNSHDFGYDNKKSINDIINKTLENCLLLDKDINEQMIELSSEIKSFEKE